MIDSKDPIHCHGNYGINQNNGIAMEFQPLSEQDIRTRFTVKSSWDYRQHKVEMRMNDRTAVR